MPAKKPSKPVVYDESKIKTLSSLEHIRLRTGMYIGRTGNGTNYEDGIYVLVKEIVDNAIDEFIMGHGKRVEISVKEQTVAIRDYGRGIPLGKVVDCVSRINTGGKYNDDVFQFSVGLNGVGTKAVNALSSKFTVRSIRDGKYTEADFIRGKLLREHKGKDKGRNGTSVEFVPDPEIFDAYTFHEEHLARRFRLYSYLNAGLSIVFNGEEYRSEGGLLDLIQDESQFEKVYQPIHYKSDMLEFSFTHTNRFAEEYYSFVNGQYTNDGGTHLSAFREGVLKGVNEYGRKRYDGDDVREGMLGAIAIRLKEPIFESQTKNKLGNQEIRSSLVNDVRKAVVDMLHRDKSKADALINKIEDTQKLRKELQSVKKLARERSKAVSIRVPQLKDCKKHFDKKRQKGLDTMIFICEGQSAAGSMVSCRNVSTQGIYTLKGKPLNVCELKRDAIYKNIEIYNLMRSLNIEDNIDNLRYNKVVLATDADVDGLHIRNLMITFFLRFFERLVAEGHLYILETPLFRVRNKKETRYCYTDSERVKAIKKLGRNPEITRFKGLGEINPAEFKDFIGAGMRLSPVDITHDFGVAETLAFYMGKNTPIRKQYIMDNLVVDTETL